MLNSALSFRGMAMAVALFAGMAVVGDASALSKKDEHAIAGAIVGGIAGHVLSNGDPAATLAGAAAGGAIGHVATSHGHDRRYDRHNRHYDRRYYRSSHHGYGHERRWQRDRYYSDRHHDRGRHHDRRHHGR